jgi:ribosomal protein S18 acetylase RimI-like enzyme
MILAFSADPAVRWMYPDPYRYLTHFPRFAQAFGSPAFAQDTAYYIDSYAGAALWFPPGIQPDENLVIEVIQETTSESQQADLFAVLEQMGHHHPNQPHWYLSMIVVEPSQQGKGYGSALMQPVLMQCNRDGIPAYLESSNPTNIPFYERHGFEVIGTIQTGTLPPIFPMMRQSQSENLEI